jgi:sugar/nucleoside kinase (ribokinase family)
VPCKDYSKLHIITHYLAVLLGWCESSPFKVFPIGKVGNDAAGRQLIVDMQQAGMDTDHVAVLEGIDTLFSVCFQYPDGSGGNLTNSNSASAGVEPDDIDNFFTHQTVSEAGEIMLAVPEVPVQARIRLLQIGRERGSLNISSVLSSEADAFARQDGFDLTDLLAVNIDEAATLAGIAGKNMPAEAIVDRCISRLIEINANMRVIITDGAHGSYGYMSGNHAFIPALKTDAVSTAGAGDALLAGVIAGLVCGLPFLKKSGDTCYSESPVMSALELGTLLASLSVTSPDSIHKDADADLLYRYAQHKNVRMSDDFKAIF